MARQGAVVMFISKNKKDYYIGLLGALAPMIFIWFFTIGREITLHFGYNGILASQFESGLLPYKDIPIWAPPLNTLIITYVHQWLGDSFFVYIIIGCISRIIICWLTYKLFCTIYPILISAVATGISGVVFASWWFTGNWFTWNEIGFAVGLGVAIIFIGILNDLNSNKKLPLFKFLVIGLLCGLSIISKQTFGLLTLTLVALFTVLLLKEGIDRKNILKGLAALSLGCIVVLLAMGIYLIKINLLVYVLQSTTSDAIEGKGGLFKILFHHFKEIVTYEKISIVILLVTILVFILGRKANVKREFKIAWIITLVLIIVSIVAGYFYVELTSYQPAYIFSKFYNVTLSVGRLFQGFVTIAAVLLFFKVTFGRDKNTKLFIKLVIFGTVTSLAYGMSTSQASACLQFYNFGLVFAFLLSSQQYNRLKNIWVLFLIISCVFLFSVKRFSVPYHWYAWWGTPTYQAKYSSAIPALSGFKLGLEEKLAFENIYNIVNKYTSKDDKILVFNNAQIFYALTERLPYTSYATHHIDLILDSVAKKEAKIIQDNPPPVIIYLREPDYVYSFFEYAYRGGKRSGLHMIDEAIDSMIDDKVYSVEAVYYPTIDINTQKNLKIHFLPNLAQDFSLRVLVRRDLLDSSAAENSNKIF